MPQLVLRLTGDLQSVRTQVDLIENNLKSPRRVFNKTNAIAFVTSTLAGGLATLSGAVTVALVAYRKTEESQQKLKAILGSLSKGNEEVFKNAIKLSEGLSKLSLFTRENINEIQTTLFGFQNISQDLIPRAAQAVLDIATGMQIDTASAAKALGKALSDPADSLNSLRLAGIQLNKEQEKTIKALAEVGRIQEAQIEVLKLVEDKFRNQAFNQTLGTGVFIQLKNTMQALTSEIGRNIAPELVLAANELLKIVRIINEKQETIFAAKVAIVATFRQVGLALLVDFLVPLFRIVNGIIKINKGILEFIFGKGTFLQTLLGGAEEIGRAFELPDVREELAKIPEDTFNEFVKRQEQFLKAQTDAFKATRQEVVEREETEVEAIKNRAFLKEQVEKEIRKKITDMQNDFLKRTIEFVELTREDEEIFKEELRTKEVLSRHTLFLLQAEAARRQGDLDREIQVETEIERLNNENEVRQEMLKNQGDFYQVTKSIFMNETETMKELNLEQNASRLKIEQIGIGTREDLLTDLFKTALIGLETNRSRNFAAYKALQIAISTVETLKALGTLGFFLVIALAHMNFGLAAIIVLFMAIVTTAYAGNVRQIIATEPVKHFQLGSGGNIPVRNPARAGIPGMHPSVIRSKTKRPKEIILYVPRGMGEILNAETMIQ